MNLWLCPLSVLLVAITAFSLGVPLSAIGIGLAIPPLLFYFIYVEDRRSVSPEDWVNQPTRTAVVEASSKGLLLTEIIGLLLYELILIYYFFTRPQAPVWILLFGQVPFVVLVLYDRFKQVPSADSLAVAGTWTFIGMFAVVVSTGHGFSVDVQTASLGWFLIVFAGVESRNIQDVNGDTDSEKPSLAALLGVKRAKGLEVGLKLAGVAVFWSFAGAAVAAMVIGYLLVIRGFRALTNRAQLPVSEAQLVSDHRSEEISDAAD